MCGESLILSNLQFAVVLSPVLFVLAVVLLRAYLELVASIFRIAENTTEMAVDLNKP